MGLVYTRRDDGLVLAQASQDEAAVARALKQHDPELRLVPQESEVLGKRCYKVYRYAGSERPAEFILAWVKDGDPLPLSMGLVDAVKALDRNSRVEYLNEDERDALERERRDKQTAADIEDIRSDWATREKRSAVLPRSPSLRRARSRSGYHEGN